MSITVVCSSCLRRLKFRNEESGLSRKCSNCGKEITVPGEAVAVPKSRGGFHAPGRTAQFVIAGVILVVGLVGAVCLYKHFQKVYGENQFARSSVNDLRRDQAANQASKPKPKVAANNVKPDFKTIAEFSKDHSELQLGPGTFVIQQLETAVETPVYKIQARRGYVFAVVSLNLKSVAPGPACDVSSLILATPLKTEYEAKVVTGTDSAGNPFETPRKRLTSMEVDTTTGVNLGIYFEIPDTLDPKTCQLRYK